MDYDDERLKEQVQELTLEKFGVHCDIGVSLRFFLVGKRFAWGLPESAQKRAKELKALNEGLSNLKVYVIDPLDILILKCDRMEEQDIRDIEKILLQHDIPFAELEKRFSEFYQLLEGDSIEFSSKNIIELYSTIASTLGKILDEYKTRTVEELIDISDEQLHQILTEISGILKITN